MFAFSDPVTKIPKIGTKISNKLSGLGIITIEDLLYHFPHRYEDFSTFKIIGELAIGETVTIQGQIEDIKTKRTWKKRMTITECYLKDDTGTIKAVWFNNPLPVKFLSQGKFVQLSGKVVLSRDNEPHLQHPNFEIIKKTDLGEIQTKSASSGGLASIYPETLGLNSYWFRRIIKQVLSQTKIEEFLPQDVIKDQKLVDLKNALENIHFPKASKDAERAKKRFAFEKMFLIQLKALQVKKDWDANQAVSIKFDEKTVKKFVDSLPFKLTDAQKKTSWQIIQDLGEKTPMNRLLEGDVGSGKTVVAVMAILSVINRGHQVALLAPTEVLAVQHFDVIKDLLKDHEVALLTSSQKKSSGSGKNDLKKAVNKGEIDVVIGTHAILQKKVGFKNLALVIIDEQHRFGVNQRAHLQQKAARLDDGKKKTIPHLLTMTATPIPRTLSLAIFGNLEFSIIDEFPKGRKQIKTSVVGKSGRAQVYQFIEKEIKSGRQVFVICPLVEESSKITEVKAATEELIRLQKKVFLKFTLGLLHGKMKPKEKNRIMSAFKDKKIDILVSTSVVEVGVDIPNATIMMIEGAERFGLAQLHQFRGRVGRGKHQSYCFLFTSDNAPDSTSRLRAMEKTNDGFKIAEADLKLRGPCQFMGTLQSGLPDVAMESLSDVKTIQAARDQAQRIIAFDPKLKKFPLLKEQVEKLDTITHWE